MDANFAIAFSETFEIRLVESRSPTATFSLQGQERSDMKPTVPPVKSPAIRDFIRAQVEFPDTFKAPICDRDEMYLFALQNQGSPPRAIVRYYFNGIRIFEAVKQAVNWHFKGFDTVSSFLDFASGYGRSTRFFIQAIPPEKVWISDIYADGVKFQAEQFGVNGIISTSQPENYSCPQTFDCILACSFFSHLPKQTFSDWLRVLYNLLNPDGLLLFSVHDRALLPPHLAIPSSELLFCLTSESQTLDLGEYGTSYVGEEFVKNAIAQVSAGAAVYHRIPKGICRYQDLYIVAKTPAIDFSNFRYYHHPQGRLERCRLTPAGILELGGWVSEINPGGTISEITVLINNRLSHVEKVKADKIEKNDKIFWHLRFKPDRIKPQDTILIKTANNFGLEWVFESAPLEFILNQ